MEDAKPEKQRQESENPDGNRRLKLLLILIGVILTIVVLAHVVAAVVAPPPVQVWVLERNTLLETAVATGEVEARTLIPVGAVTQGVVVAVSVEEGDTVRSGDLLVEIDPAAARGAVEVAEAEIDRARSRLEQVRTHDNPLASAKLARAEVVLGQARRNVERMELLLTAGARPQIAVEEARSALASAEEAHATARLEVEATGPEGSRYAAALAELKAAMAAAERARVGLAETRILAMSTGVVLERRVEPGTAVRPGVVVLELLPLGPTYLTVDMDESAAARLSVGDAALATADAVPERSFEAHVVHLAPSVNRDRGTLRVRLLAPDPPGFLRPNMSVSVTIESDRSDRGLAVPASAVVEDEIGAVLYLVRGGRVERARIEIGLSGPSRLEVLGPVAAGDTVIVPDGELPQVGSTVSTKPWTPSVGTEASQGGFKIPFH